MLHQMINLLLVMPVDKSFYRCDRCINGMRTKQSRQSTGQPTRQAPWPQKSASHGHGQPSLHQHQMLSFCFTVQVCKCQQVLVSSPLGYRCDASVDAHGAGFTSVV